MEAKKNPSLDIHRMYPATLLAGFCISIAIVIAAFEIRFKALEYQASYSEWDNTVCVLPALTWEVKQEATPQQVKRATVVPVPSILVVSSDPPLEDLPPFEDPVEPISYIAPVIPEPTVSDEPITLAEEMPVPDGGFEGFYRFVGKEMRYPRKAVHSEVEGRVFVEFVIDREGNPTAIKVLRGIGHGCDEEAMRVLAMTHWTAGRQHGKPVRVRMVLPILFSLWK